MQQVYRTIDSAASSKAVFLLRVKVVPVKYVLKRFMRRVNVVISHFIAINCAAIPKDLIESELFGHVKGGVYRRGNRPSERGWASDGGTLFMMKLCEMDLELQTKLLRFIRTRHLPKSRFVEDEKCRCSFLFVRPTAIAGKKFRRAFRRFVLSFVRDSSALATIAWAWWRCHRDCVLTARIYVRGRGQSVCAFCSRKCLIVSISMNGLVMYVSCKTCCEMLWYWTMVKCGAQHVAATTKPANWKQSTLEREAEWRHHS